MFARVWWGGGPEGRRPLGRHRRRWDENVKIRLQVVGCESRDWIAVAQDRDRCLELVQTVPNLRLV